MPPRKTSAKKLTQPSDAVLDALHKVCDTAQAATDADAVAGVPARYVSGYLYSEGAQVASHAWAEAWTLDRWRSFDISNSRSAGEDHIKLAIGADYLDACPIRGTRIGGGGETMAAVASVAQSQQ